MSEERKEWARTYREAAEAHLGGRKVEAAGVFQRPGRWLGLVETVTIEAPFRGLEWLKERLTMGRLGRLHGSFLLAVTNDKVHAFKYRGGQNFQVQKEIAVFDRDEVRLRSAAGGEVIYLSAPERGRTRAIDLDAELLKEHPGAAEVLAALSE